MQIIGVLIICAVLYGAWTLLREFLREDHDPKDWDK